MKRVWNTWIFLGISLSVITAGCRQECPNCDGAGKVVCKHCVRGEVINVFNGLPHTCKICNGTGFVQCTVCAGHPPVVSYAMPVAGVAGIGIAIIAIICFVYSAFEKNQSPFPSQKASSQKPHSKAQGTKHRVSNTRQFRQDKSTVVQAVQKPVNIHKSSKRGLTKEEAIGQLLLLILSPVNRVAGQIDRLATGTDKKQDNRDG